MSNVPIVIPYGGGGGGGTIVEVLTPTGTGSGDYDLAVSLSSITTVESIFIMSGLYNNMPTNAIREAAWETENPGVLFYLAWVAGATQEATFGVSGTLNMSLVEGTLTIWDSSSSYFFTGDYFVVVIGT